MHRARSGAATPGGGGGDRPPAVRLGRGTVPQGGDDGHVTAGSRARLEGCEERNGAGAGAGWGEVLEGSDAAPTPGDVARLGTRGSPDFGMERNFLLTSLPSPPSTSSFVFAGEDRAFPFTVTLIEHLGCAGESDPLNYDSTAREKSSLRGFEVPGAGREERELVSAEGVTCVPRRREDAHEGGGMGGRAGVMRGKGEAGRGDRALGIGGAGLGEEGIWTMTGV